MTSSASATPPDAGDDAPAALTAGAELEAQIAKTGDELLAGLSSVVGALRLPPGPQALATGLNIDKVLASRVLKSIDNTDPMSAIHRVPGPEPLRRLLRASAKRGVPDTLIADAQRAVDRFEELIRDQLGDRSALETIVSSWLPEARREFELRRKQAAFRAMSQLKGVQSRVTVATAFLHPSSNGEKVDVVWVTGSLGLVRTRPGAVVRFATRRIAPANGGRLPTDLDGRPVKDISRLQLEEYSTKPVPRLDVREAGEVTHYTLSDTGFGPKSEVSVLFAEANFGELFRYVSPDVAGKRRAYVFAEVSTPCQVLQLDVFVHPDLYPNQNPELLIYDAAFDGVADINDPARDIDRMDMMESVQSLGRGISSARSADVPRYPEMLRGVCARLGWDGDAFRAHRCRISYPLYGSQITMAFATVARD